MFISYPYSDTIVDTKILNWGDTMRYFAIWGIAATLMFLIVKGTKIGPTIFVISSEHGWGIHVGDALILIPFIVAVIITVLMVKRSTVNQVS